MSKIISISDDIYSSLAEIKGKESFSGIIRKLLSKKDNKEKILSLAGKGGIDAEEIVCLKKEWKKWNARYA